MTVVTVIRKIVGAIVILAALAAACAGVMLCIHAMNAEPYIEDGENGPTATLDRFLSAMERKDFESAYALLYNYSTLGLEEVPTDELSRMYWQAQLDAWHFTAAEGGEMNGTRMSRRVTLRCLDMNAISTDVGARVQQILAEKVENAYLRSEVYDETGAYRPELAYEALHTATKEMLSDTSRYAYEQECTLSLRFSDGRWLVEVDPAFISALTSGAVRG